MSHTKNTYTGVDNTLYTRLNYAISGDKHDFITARARAHRDKTPEDLYTGVIGSQ